IRGHETAHAHFAAAVTDDDLAVDDARRAGDRVALRRIGRLHAPRGLAGLHVERDQASVERADEDLVAPHADTAIHDVAARVHRLRADHLRIEAPFLFAGARVERVHLAPCRRHVHRAVDDDRRRLLAAARIEIEVPREAELLYVVFADLLQR